MSEEKTPGMPRRLWQSAVKAVKGDNTQALVEQFTSEMTLVAEGLAEDQALVRTNLEKLEAEHEKSVHRFEAGQEALTRDLDDTQKALSRRLDELGERLDALSERTDAMARSIADMEARQKSRDARKDKDRKLTLVQQITIPVALVCATLIILAVLRLF